MSSYKVLDLSKKLRRLRSFTKDPQIMKQEGNEIRERIVNICEDLKKERSVIVERISTLERWKKDPQILKQEGPSIIEELQKLNLCMEIISSVSK